MARYYFLLFFVIYYFTDNYHFCYKLENVVLTKNMLYLFIIVLLNNIIHFL